MSKCCRFCREAQATVSQRHDRRPPCLLCDRPFFCGPSLNGRDLEPTAWSSAGRARRRGPVQSCIGLPLGTTSTDPREASSIVRAAPLSASRPRGVPACDPTTIRSATGGSAVTICAPSFAASASAVCCAARARPTGAPRSTQSRRRGQREDPRPQRQPVSRRSQAAAGRRRRFGVARRRSIVGGEHDDRGLLGRGQLFQPLPGRRREYHVSRNIGIAEQ